MKKFILFFSLAALLWSGELTWSHDYNQTLSLSKKEKKPILMIYFATWCPECNYMEEVVFKDPKLQEYIRTHFLPLSLDISKDPLPPKFIYKGVPTFFVISPDNKEIGKFEGSAAAIEFIEKLKRIR